MLGQCGSRNCAVDTCPVSEVPEHVLNHKDVDKDVMETHSPVSYLQEKLKEFLPLVEPLVVYFKQFAEDYLPSQVIVVYYCLFVRACLYPINVKTAEPIWFNLLW